MLNIYAARKDERLEPDEPRDNKGRREHGPLRPRRRRPECGRRHAARPGVSQGPIETHALYGAATPNVGSAWALPRAHPLWAPMDFECRELTKETPEQREERLKRFEPPQKPRRQLTSEEIVDVRKKCRAHFASKKNADEGRVDFMATDRFEGKKPGYYFGRSAKGMGYHIDYAQMRRLMTLSPGDRCEARYQKVRRYFDGVICAAHA